VDDEIEGCFPKPTSIPISVNGREYGPTAGIKPLRAAIANLYNDNYRKEKSSQYSWENVCVVPGGRAGLIRIAAVLGNAYLGFFVRTPSDIHPTPCPLPLSDASDVHGV
jgi:aspartate/methionine/tyrosine aminotransferase